MELLQISCICLRREESGTLYILVSCSDQLGSSFFILGISQGSMGERKDKSKVEIITVVKVGKDLRDFLLKLSLLFYG